MLYSLAYRRILNRMGYDSYLHNLIYRHLNQGDGWDNHLKNCRNFILRAMDFHNPSVVTLLGTGWLLDVPLKELSERTDQINLVDIFHPAEVRTQATGLKNVVLRENDVTGGLILNTWQEGRYRMVLRKLATLKNILIPEYQPDFETGLVISLNIMTQLEFLPVEFLKKRSDVPEEEYIRFRKEIQEKHLLFLKKHKSALITDVAEIFTDRSGKSLEVPSLLAELPPGKINEEWTWNFDTRRSDYYNKRSVFRVSALIY